MSGKENAMATISINTLTDAVVFCNNAGIENWEWGGNAILEGFIQFIYDNCTTIDQNNYDAVISAYLSSVGENTNNYINARQEGDVNFFIKHHRHGWFKCGCQLLETAKKIADDTFDPPFEIWSSKTATGHRKFMAGRNSGERWSDERWSDEK